MAHRRTGVLIVTAWLDDDGSPQLHARVTRTLDVAAHREASSVTASRGELLAIVRAWIDEFVGDGGGGDAPVTEW